jgi:hypothetical protein
MRRKQSNNEMLVEVEPLMYNNFVRLYGMKDVIPCHALCYYAFNLGYYLESQEGKFEKDVRAYHDPKQSMLSIAELYGVSPEAMLSYWPEIDRVFALHKFKSIPNEQRYRHTSVLVSQDGNPILRLH